MLGGTSQNGLMIQEALLHKELMQAITQVLKE